MSDFTVNNGLVQSHNAAAGVKNRSSFGDGDNEPQPILPIPEDSQPLQAQSPIPPESDPQPAPDDPFDPNRLRLSQAFGAVVKLKKVLTVVSVRKPSREWFIRVHPGEDYRLVAAIIELKDDREIHLVSRELLPELAGEATFSPRLLVTAVNRQGIPFIWPLRLPGEDGKSDGWTQSALNAVKMAETQWVRVTANMSSNSYDVRTASFHEEPQWPEEPLGTILEIAFKGDQITTLNHPVLRRLRGEV